jgi:hypothetical protein
MEDGLWSATTRRAMVRSVERVEGGISLGITRPQCGWPLCMRWVAITDESWAALQAVHALRVLYNSLTGKPLV